MSPGPMQLTTEFLALEVEVEVEDEEERDRK